MRGASNVGATGSRGLEAGAGGVARLDVPALFDTERVESEIVMIDPAMSVTVWIGACITGVIDTICSRFCANGICIGVTHCPPYCGYSTRLHHSFRLDGHARYNVRLWSYWPKHHLAPAWLLQLHNVLWAPLRRHQGGLVYSWLGVGRRHCVRRR